MSTQRGRRHPTTMVVCALAAAIVSSLTPRPAHAFELRHTSHGQPIKWSAGPVSFVVDPSVGAAVSGGGEAADRAVAAWSGAAGAPGLSASAGAGGGKAAVDGQNTILYAPDGFEPAGDALAVTVLSYDDLSGAIVDADIVIDGRRPFAVLPDGAQPPRGTSPVSTEGGDDPDEHGRGHATPFDLTHVVTHEVGHALGLGDVPDIASAVMYAYSMPGDASGRAPGSDDLDGLDALYAGSASSPSARIGCGQSSVAGGRVRDADAWGALALVLGAGVWLAMRRRAARGIVPVGAALLALAADPASARSATRVSATAPDARAVVVEATTRDVGGVFQTTLELAPRSCRDAGACPARAEARVWGGTIGGITQQVGEHRAPRPGDEVDVVFDRGAAVGRTAVVLAARP
jgi:hypothetical protein